MKALIVILMLAGVILVFAAIYQYARAALGPAILFGLAGVLFVMVAGSMANDLERRRHRQIVESELGQIRTHLTSTTTTTQTFHWRSED